MRNRKFAEVFCLKKKNCYGEELLHSKPLHCPFKTSKAEVSSSSSMKSGLDSSRFVERSKFAFQEFMHCLDCKVTKAKSFFVSVVPPTSRTALSISRKSGLISPQSFGTLKVYILAPSPSSKRWKGQIFKAFISFALM